LIAAFKDVNTVGVKECDVELDDELDNVEVDRDNDDEDDDAAVVRAIVPWLKIDLS
jgi:hypothetical protein